MKAYILSFTLAISLGLSGCALGPNLTNRQSGAVTGGVLGTVTAILVGAETGEAVAAGVGGAALGYWLADPECTYTLNESSSTYGNHATPWSGVRNRHCQMSGPANQRPDFNVPVGVGKPRVNWRRAPMQ